MGSTLFGGPQTTRVPPPNPLFPGASNDYIGALRESGVAPASFSGLTSMAKTGNPTDVGPAFDALKAASKTGIEEGARDLKEQFGGALGLTDSSSLGTAAADYETKVTSNLNQTLANYTMQAQEAAAGRQLTAETTGAQLASEPALAFTPSAVISQTPGLLGGIADLFGSLFPKGLGTGAIAI